jgi:hypothetical protein
LIAGHHGRFHEWVIEDATGVIIFTPGAAFVAGAITAPATDAASAPPVPVGAWMQQGSPPTHAAHRGRDRCRGGSRGPREEGRLVRRRDAWIGSHSAIRAVVSYVHRVSPNGYDLRANTSLQAFSAWQAFRLDSYG